MVQSVIVVVGPEHVLTYLQYVRCLVCVPVLTGVVIFPSVTSTFQ